MNPSGFPALLRNSPQEGKALLAHVSASSRVKLRKGETDTSPILRQHSELASDPMVHLAAIPRSSSTLNHLTAGPEMWEGSVSLNAGYWTFLLLKQPQYSVSAWDSFWKKAILQHTLDSLRLWGMPLFPFPKDPGKPQVEQTTCSRNQR